MLLGLATFKESAGRRVGSICSAKDKLAKLFDGYNKNIHRRWLARRAPAAVSRSEGLYEIYDFWEASRPSASGT